MAQGPAPELAEKIAWRNGEALLSHFWKTAQSSPCAGGRTWLAGPLQARGPLEDGSLSEISLSGKHSAVQMTLPPIRVSEAFTIEAALCPLEKGQQITRVAIDASMPEHQHGMNYRPSTQLSPHGDVALAEQKFVAKNMVYHMPGRWQIELQISGVNKLGQMWSAPDRLRYDIQVK